MNIWALEKDNSIKQLLLMLMQDMGAESIQLIDIEELHDKAVRIGSPNSSVTAYLYTYGQTKEHYGLHLEYPDHEDANIGTLEDIYEDLSYENLLEVLKLNF